jgi:hypothetical protein
VKVLAVLSVWSEPVSARFPCLTGKMQGNLRNLPDPGEIYTNKELILILFLENSLEYKTGKFLAGTGNQVCDSGNLIANLPRASLAPIRG